MPVNATPPLLLRLSDATIGYDGTAVVKAANLEIRASEVVALLGANGSGKSTLVRGILGLATLLDGGIELFGEPIARFRQRGRIGYVPQRQTIGPGLPATVTEVVTSGRLALVKPWRRLTGRDRKQVREAIEIVGLGGRAHDPVASLSGGQQRRVLIARALATEAELLILDEPTAGVDAETQQNLTDTMADLVQRGVTIVLVTHELGPAAAIVTRSVQLRDGSIVYDGSPRPSDLRSDAHHHDEPTMTAGHFGLTS